MRLCIGAKKRKNKSKKRSRSRAFNSSGGAVGTGGGSRCFITRPTSGITDSATVSDILKIQENYYINKDGSLIAVGTNDGSCRSRASNSSGVTVGTDGDSHPSSPRPRPEEYPYDESGNSEDFY